MSTTLLTVSYLGAAILFILSLGGLSNPESSRRGNLYGMIGMAIAVLATALGPQVSKAAYPWIIGAMLIGGLWSLWALRKSLLSGIKTGMAMKAGSHAGLPHTERDLPMKAVMTGIVLFVIPIFALYYVVAIVS